MADNVTELRVVPYAVTVQKEAVEALREWLEMAERGEIVEVAIVGFDQEGAAHSRLALTNDKMRAIGALDILKYKMLTRWIEPATGET